MTATPLNILMTGTRRGIGTGIKAALAGHNAADQSTRGGAGDLAADFANPDQVTAFWWQGRGQARRTGKRAGQQCRHV